MGTSGNPANKQSVSSAKDFKSRKYKVLELPSGLTAKVSNAGGLGTFMRAGMIPNSLMGIVDRSLKGAKPELQELQDVKIDQQTIVEMMEFFDKMMVKVMMDPIVHPVPSEEEVRDDELLYVDEVDDDDKMFVFQWLSGGTADLVEFRERQAQNVAALGGGDKVGL